MTEYRPIFDPEKVVPLVRPLKRQVEATLADQTVEVLIWKERAIRNGCEVLMVTPGVPAGTQHWEARPLRPGDV